MRKPLLYSAAVVVTLGVIGACSAGTDSAAPAKPAATASSKAPASKEVEAEPAKSEADDVKVTSCRKDNVMGWPTATLEVTNSSSKASDYLISVEFVNSKGDRLADSFAAVNKLAPGQKSKEEAPGAEAVDGAFECRVSSVERHETLMP